MNRISHRRLERGSRWSQLGITPIGIFLLLLHQNAFTKLILTCTLKDRSCTRYGFIECDLTGLHDMVSFKVKYTISSRMRSITKKYPIRGPGLRLVQITLLEHEALASKHPEMAYLGWQPKPQLIRCLLHKGSKKNAVRNMASGVDCLSPIFPRCPMLIEHRPSHLNQSPIFALNNTILLGDIRRAKTGARDPKKSKRFQNEYS